MKLKINQFQELRGVEVTFPAIFSRKNFQKSPTFFDNSRKYLQLVYITY